MLSPDGIKRRIAAQREDQARREYIEAYQQHRAKALLEHWCDTTADDLRRRAIQQHDEQMRARQCRNSYLRIVAFFATLAAVHYFWS